MPVGLDLPRELAGAPGHPELVRRPADPPRIDAAALPRVERPDELDGDARVGVVPGGQRHHQAHALPRGHAVVPALAEPRHDPDGDGGQQRREHDDAPRPAPADRAARGPAQIARHGRGGSTVSGSTGTPPLADREVEMRPGRVPGQPDRPEHLARRDLVALRTASAGLAGGRRG